MLGFRVAVSLLVAAIALVVPASLHVKAGQVAAATAGYGLLTALSHLISRGARRKVSVAVFGLMLIVDGIYLAATA